MIWTISDEELEISVPKFAHGLEVLLVDHDIPSLTSLSSMLQRYTFNVTAVETTKTAISIVRDWKRDQQDRLKLVMAHLNLVIPEHLSFLQTMVKETVPIILISSDKDLSNAREALCEGAAFIYQKPVALPDLKYVWQFACPRKIRDTGKDDPPHTLKRKLSSMEILPPVISNDCNNKAEAVPRGQTNQTFQIAEGSCSKHVPQPLVIGQEVRNAESPNLQNAMKRPLDGGNDRGETSKKNLKISTVKVDQGKSKVVETGKQGVVDKPKKNIVKTGKQVVVDKGLQKVAEIGKLIIVDKGKEKVVKPIIVVDTGMEKIVKTGNQNVVDAGNERVVIDTGKQTAIDKGKQAVADTGKQNSVDAGKQKALEEAQAMGNNGGTTSRKRSIVWTSEMHLKFTAALSTLGDALATPKAVHEMMNVPHLTQRHVATHLQKYKAQVQRIAQAAEEDLSASKKEKESLGRMGTCRTDYVGFDYGASCTSRFHALREPFRVWEYDHFLYEELPRRAALMKAMQPPNANQIQQNPAPSPNLGGSNIKIVGMSDNQRAPEAEGTKVQGPELNLPKTSLPLESGAGDMEYFSDLAPIISSDQLPTEFNVDLRPKFGLTGTRTEQLSAVNPIHGMPGDLPEIASAMNPLEEALLTKGLSGEASEGYLRSRGSIISNDFLMAFNDDVPMENIEFEGDPKGFADSDDKMNPEDINMYAQWLEENL